MTVIIVTGLPFGLDLVLFSRLSELFLVQDDGAVEWSPTGRLVNEKGCLTNVVYRVILQKVFKHVCVNKKTEK